MPDDEIQRVVLTKSPIDALSLATIEGIPQQKTMYLAADSAKSLPVKYLRTIPKVIAAYDSDDALNEIALAIQEQLPETERVRITGRYI
ncbi:toprim domain-containing protein [Iningainema sp. BLCCT55]|uniref:Toprim domain-containing protein n=1 Tax=Iningainema tapete BLCC-T55 TaxID=2748662 RepID=A0A8J6XG68_9CYAN|nr:toprim domain-containing protein [Iningainema tapete BLCC-T55]